VFVETGKDGDPDNGTGGRDVNLVKYRDAVKESYLRLYESEVDFTPSRPAVHSPPFT
jgi:hypothetical protein